MVAVAQKDCVNQGRQNQGMDRPVIVIVAAHHLRQQSMGDHHIMVP